MEKQILTRILEILLAENGANIEIPADEPSKKRLFRALVNVRPPVFADKEFLTLQDEYLKAEIKAKGITKLSDLSQVAPDIYLWKGDITTLECDGIVNAANSQMLGCFCPNHGCIDNAIHTCAGVQLRLECAFLLKEQGSQEPSGRAKITGAYNLPCKYVLHTVGPIVYGGRPTEKDNSTLADCYRSCLELADENHLDSLAFCCISTGEFGFPNLPAAQIAINTVAEYKRRTKSKLKVIFNVFKDIDYDIYKRLLN